MGAMQRLWAYLGFTDEEADEPVADDVQARRRATVVNLPTTRSLEIVVLEPKSLEEARTGADHLKARRPVIVNLQEADRELARRVVDFTCGVTYAIDGQMQKVGEEIFLFTPSTVTVTAEPGRDSEHDLFPVP
ncbi:MAG: cell division protein SepF [Armatimonadota bacterium]|nr:cell division protein SepF [Armatimonadota bacterium]MDR7520204.1 cell division protein SepF [Armatimonadota bacterium]MDR7549735.1 cell division protein SepF [Armatimonadota bacterium]